MSWFYLALLSPLLFAIVTLIDDNLVRHVYKSAYFGTIISGLFGALPLISLTVTPLQSTTKTVLAFGVLSGFLTVIYYYFYFRALEKESPSVVIAMFSLTPALIPILAHFYLGERLLYVQIIGFVIVLVSSFLLGLTEVRKFKISSALWYVLTASSIYAVVSIISKYVFLNTNFYTGFMYFCAGMGIGGIYFIVTLRFLKVSHFFADLKRTPKKTFSFFILAEAIAIMAEFTQNLAVSRGPVSMVKVIEGIQPIYVLLIALIFYPLSPKHFREAAEGALMKKITLMAISIIGLALIHYSVS